MPTEETGETRVRTDCLNFDVSPCIQLKKQISIRGRRHWDYTFCGILDPVAIQDYTKFPSLITNVLLQLVRDVSNGVCYQRYEKRFEQQKCSPDIKGTILTSAFDYRFSSNKHTHMFLFVTQVFWVFIVRICFFGVQSGII